MAGLPRCEPVTDSGQLLGVFGKDEATAFGAKDWAE
jgi:hypothetical protein